MRNEQNAKISKYSCIRTIGSSCLHPDHLSIKKPFSIAQIGPKDTRETDAELAIYSHMFGFESLSFILKPFSFRNNLQSEPFGLHDDDIF